MQYQQPQLQRTSSHSRSRINRSSTTAPKSRKKAAAAQTVEMQIYRNKKKDNIGPQKKITARK
jgi:hypothetical protein